MKGFFLAAALVLASGFIAVSSFAHDGDHQNTTLASAVMNGVDNEENREALKNFVMHAKAHIEEAEYIEDFLILLSEFRDEDGDWIAHDRSIYLYIFTAGEADEDGEHQEIGIFNALSPLREGTNIHDMTDANGVEVAHELIDAATEPGRDGFGEYTWDDPRIEGDEVNEPGKSPGTSPKIGYVVTVELPGGEQLTSTKFVLGSGFYPTPLMDSDSDSGCAIAGGNTGKNGLSSLFNLLLVVSALSLAVSWRIHTVRR